MSDTEKPSWEWRALVVEMRAELDGAEHLLAQRDHALRTMREVNDYDTKYQLELEAQLATTTAHLEAQRTATFQAVAREHAAKKQLALAQKGQP